MGEFWEDANYTQENIERAKIELEELLEKYIQKIRKEKAQPVYRYELDNYDYDEYLKKLRGLQEEIQRLIDEKERRELG